MCIRDSSSSSRIDSSNSEPHDSSDSDMSSLNDNGRITELDWRRACAETVHEKIFILKNF